MLIRITEVERITGLSRSTIYPLVRIGKFPSQVPIGLRAVAWVRAEVEEWARSLIAARQQDAKERSERGRRLAHAKRRKAPKMNPSPLDNGGGR
jgi:prophage regulatory protein